MKRTKLTYAHVARLVMSAMAGRPIREGEDVRHLDGDRTNCDPENLELWRDGRRLGKPAPWLVGHARWILTTLGREYPA